LLAAMTWLIVSSTSNRHAVTEAPIVTPAFAVHLMPVPFCVVSMNVESSGMFSLKEPRWAPTTLPHVSPAGPMLR
jgi:hypothetical protein